MNTPPKYYPGRGTKEIRKFWNEELLAALYTKPSNMTPTTTKNEWEERFDNLKWIREEDRLYDLAAYATKVKAFIRAEKETSEAETLKKVLEAVEGMRKTEYEYEHTFPSNIGVIGLDGAYHQTIAAGQTTRMKHQLDDDDVTYNQALSDLTNKLIHLTKE